MKTIGAIFRRLSDENASSTMPPPQTEQPVMVENETVDYNSLPVQSLRKILRREHGIEDAAALSREECLAMLTEQEAHSNESA